MLNLYTKYLMVHRYDYLWHLNDPVRLDFRSNEMSNMSLFRPVTKRHYRSVFEVVIANFSSVFEAKLAI